MKVSLKTVVESADAVITLVSANVNAPIAFKLRRLITMIEENTEILNKVKQDIITKFDLALDDEGTAIIPTELQEEIASEYKMLLDEEVDIDISIIPEDIADVKISAKDLNSIYWIFKESNDE